MRTRDKNTTGGFEPHQRNLGQKDFSERKATETERIEGMGAISAEDMIGLKDAIEKGYKHFTRQTRNTKGQKGDRRHMLSAADQANFSYGNKNDSEKEGYEEVCTGCGETVCLTKEEHGQWDHGFDNFMCWECE